MSLQRIDYAEADWMMFCGIKDFSFVHLNGQQATYLTTDREIIAASRYPGAYKPPVQFHCGLCPRGESPDYGSYPRLLKHFAEYHDFIPGETIVLGAADH